MKYGLLAFIILALIQWFIPGKMIWEKNEVLKKGQAYKFQVQPVDPIHPFKGRYITLNFKENIFIDTINRNLNYGEDVYVTLTTDLNGYAKIKDVSVKVPVPLYQRGQGGFQQSAYVKAKINYTSTDKDSITLHIDYPFEEFYMDEYKAPQAENIYLESTRDSLQKTYALVKIWKGEGVIQNVFINDIPIRQLIK